ncbi:uncharacterized protein BYT42DRAFT_589292 [Radiomyces spectabilis]|uniref:uncharacterized protein n=1 Tax=Radiomyces spectabilis TaxID=64574 RepID=UPI00221E3F8E|nr:uncharacterized protein BYT42DRAFT_589292 [Radiomyces spectabilis]KAI8365242.1 hypothetical protein BYT42DRAFT_589292 [Radiomyces spectabilis]
MNRRKSHRTKKVAEFEDFGLGDHDFPHHRSPPMATAAAVGTPSSRPTVSPTLPRLNEQGNYYNENPEAYARNPYNYPQDRYTTDMSPGGQMYYQPQQAYYEDAGPYYYNHNVAPAPIPPEHGASQGAYPAEGYYYKPDVVDDRHPQRL